MLLVLTSRYDEDWTRQRPDLDRYAQLREEMGERLPGYEPPQKDEPDGHPWFRYVLKVGWPAALATAIIGWWLFDGSKLIKEGVEFQRQQLESSRMMQQEHTVIRERLDRAERMQGVVIDLLRAQCVNAARTFGERNACLTAGSNR